MLNTNFATGGLLEETRGWGGKTGKLWLRTDFNAEGKALAVPVTVITKTPGSEFGDYLETGGERKSFTDYTA